MECILDHIVLNVEDEATMIRFYSQVLMLPTERLEEYRIGTMPFPSVRLNRHTIIGLFPKKLWQRGLPQGRTHTNMNHFCIALPQNAWEMLVERLRANKVAIEEGPVPRWGAHGTGVSVYFRDPEQNLIEARYYEGQGETKPCLLSS